MCYNMEESTDLLTHSLNIRKCQLLRIFFSLSFIYLAFFDTCMSVFIYIFYNMYKHIPNNYEYTINILPFDVHSFYSTVFVVSRNFFI